MKTIYKGLLIQRQENSNRLLFSRISIKRKNALKELYSLLKCDIIDIQERTINGKTNMIFKGD